MADDNGGPPDPTYGELTPGDYVATTVVEAHEPDVGAAVNRLASQMRSVGGGIECDFVILAVPANKGANARARIHHAIGIEREEV